MNKKTLTTILIIAVLWWLFTKRNRSANKDRLVGCPPGQKACIRQGQPLQTGGFKMHNLGCMTEQACIETPIPV